jgi:flagellar M-ring protein FliF
MDALKAQLDRVREQLAGLTGSQRMLVGTLVAVMALTLAYWGKFAGTPDMVPALDQTLTDEEMGPINRQLDMSGVPHSIVNGRVMVPADRRQEVLANLMFAQALPTDTHSAFEEMSAKNLTWFSGQTEREQWATHAIEAELAAAIRRWPGVGDARVVINAKNERHIGESIPPTATVDIRTRGAADKSQVKQLVQAAADGVAGAVSGMTPQNIRVIVDGRSTRVPAASEIGGIDVSSAIEMKEQSEAWQEQKIRNCFSFIPQLTAIVTCDVDTQTRDEHRTEYDKTKAVVLAQTEHTQSAESHTSDAGGHEPGAASNDGISGPGGAGDNGGPSSGPVTSNTTSTSDEQTGNQIFVPTTVTNSSTPAGKVTVVSAAVNIPMSYIARQFKQSNPAVKDPSPADLQRQTTVELAKLKDQVAKVVGLATPAAVSVDTFADDATADLTMAVAAGPSITSPSAALGGLADHAKEIGVGVLAVVSLAMMFQMARKSSVILPVGGHASLAGMGMASMSYGDGGDDEEEEPSRTPEVRQASMLIGGMEGMELDAETVRTQQMLDQVSTLVKEDPDAAAALVKRWVARA